MGQTTTNEAQNPVTDSSGNAGRSPLDVLVREGARKMLQAALESEVQNFLEHHASRVDDQGLRLIARNGHLPTRETVTGAGPLEIAQPRVRNKSPEVAERVRFSSSILPPYLRKSRSMEELIPWLYLTGPFFLLHLAAIQPKNPSPGKSFRSHPKVKRPISCPSRPPYVYD